MPMPETLEFEEPIAVLLKEIEALDAAAAHRRARSRDRDAAAPRRDGARRALPRRSRRGSACSSRAIPSRPGPRGLHPAPVHRLRRDSRRPPVRRRPRDHDRLRRLQGPAGAARRPRQGRRHEGEDLPELRLRAAGGLPQGAARDAAGREVPPRRSSCSSTRRRRIPASSRRSAAWPRRLPSTCAT